MKDRPTYRHQYAGGARPCPWIGCNYHLIWTVSKIDQMSDDKILKVLSEMPETCTLDVADKGGLSFRKLAIALGLSRSRAMQLVIGDKSTKGAIERLRHISRRHILEPFAS